MNQIASGPSLIKAVEGWKISHFAENYETMTVDIPNFLQVYQAGSRGKVV